MYGSGQNGGEGDSATRERRSEPPPVRAGANAGRAAPGGSAMAPNNPHANRDGRRQPAPAVPAPAGRTPPWLIGLSALLVAVGTTGRGSSSPRPVADDRRQSEAGHGGEAVDKPSNIPPRGWKDVLLRVYHGISDDRILLIAAGVTFYALLAIFPGIAALVSVYGLFANPSGIASHLDTVSSIAPSGAIDVLRSQLTHLAAKGSATLGFGFVISLAISLWTATSGVTSVFDALNAAFEEKEKRGFIKYYAVGLLFTVAGIVFIVLALAILIALPMALNYLPMAQVVGVLVEILRWPILFVLVAFALAVLYRFGPSRAEPRWRWITSGSIFATIAWLAASALFSWYAANFGSYNKTYGSLGAIVGFMTWVWISTAIVLIGAKLDAEIERRSPRKGASSPPQPLGAAASGSADRIGAARS